MINEYPELLSQEIIERASKRCTPQLCDGMRELGIEGYGCMRAEVSPVVPTMKFIGTAATVETVGHGDNFPIHLAIYGVPRNGYVMVIDGKGHTDSAYFGDLMMSASQAAGYVGVVVDSYARDYLGLVELNFPVFCTGYIPTVGNKKDPGNINVPIMCGGIKVKPGDLVVGDNDGVCVVPRERIIEVLVIAEKKANYEVKRVATITDYRKAKAAGEELPELAPQWVLDMLK